MRSRRPLPPIYLLVSMLAMLVLDFVNFLLPGVKLFREPWSFVGLVPFSIGVILNLAADRAFKKHRTAVKPVEKPTALITDGVFVFSRNPMYLGYVLMLIGVAVLLGSLPPYAVIVVFVVLMTRHFIIPEERTLEWEFGEAWTDYTSKVRRWI